MPVRPEGTPCWADAMFSDVEAAKTFYGEVLGWTFGESSARFGHYTQAYADGGAAAAVVPPMPGQEGQPQWCLYFASPDAEATARRIREHGGEVLLEPMRVGDFGTMCLAREPSGAVFGVWQSGTHEGFGATGVPGAYCWAELFTREPEKADAFLTSVFGYTARRIEDEAIDFSVYDLNGETVLGRMRMTDDFPPQVPSYLNVYFTVADCDAAVSAATRLGGAVRFGPTDTPFGRFAVLADPQGALFSVIDITRAQREKPQVKDAS
ncbi:VOC family protein [Streptomyces sp. NPDC004042]|uniref:VOC family protein n=1 Tax=Streptomyces sp. NPDC004042 TaxID=3154451 RepID=UPI0033BD23D7